MQSITLAELLSYAGGSAGGTMYTPWVNFPSEYRQADLWVDVKSHDTGTVQVEVLSSIDTTSEVSLTSMGLTSLGLTVSAITANLGPLVRLKISNSAAAARALFSIHIVPKQD